MKFRKDKNIDQIIDGCISGDRKCQELLFKRLYGKMMTVVMTYIKDGVQNILSDSFIKVFANIYKFEKKENIDDWVRSIVVNTAIDSLMKNKNAFIIDHQIINDSELLKSEDEDFTSDNIAPEKIIEVIQSLQPGYRVIFNLRLFEGMSHSEIANRLEIKEDVSKSNYSKARNIVKDKVLNLE